MTKGRVEWFDCAKGVAIVIIVFHHVVSGSKAEYSDWFLSVYNIVQALGMPTFFFVSGILMNGSVQRNSLNNFIRNKSAYFLYLYVIWNTIDVIGRSLLSRFANNKVTIDKAAELLWEPSFVMWFLYAMFWISLFAFASKSVNKITMVLLVVLISIVSKSGFTQDFPFFVIHAISYLPFFMIGLLFSLFWKEWISELSAGYGIFIVFVTMFLFLAVDLISRDDIATYYLYGILSALFLLKLSAKFNNTKLSRWFAYIGNQSLFIFLLHSIPAAAFRAIFTNFSESSELIAFLSTIFTVGFCMVFYRYTKGLAIFSYIYTYKWQTK